MEIPGPVPFWPHHPFGPVQKLASTRLAPFGPGSQAIRTRLAPFVEARQRRGVAGRSFALGYVAMGPKSKAVTVASRKAGAAKMAKALGTTARLKITPKPAPHVHGSRARRARCLLGDHVWQE